MRPKPGMPTCADQHSLSRWVPSFAPSERVLSQGEDASLWGNGSKPTSLARAWPRLTCGLVFSLCSRAQMVSQQDKDAPKPDKHFVDATEGHEGAVMVVSAPHGGYGQERGGIWNAWLLG